MTSSFVMAKDPQGAQGWTGAQFGYSITGWREVPRDLLSGTPYLFLTRGLSLTGERMRIGILSDTHDNLPMVEGAVARLNGISPDLVLHAGDFVSPFVIPRLARLSCPCIGVFGNNDGDRILLAAKAREAGNVEIHGCFTVRQADGRSIALLHGHEPGDVDEIAGAGIFDVVVHGHTHRPSITERGGTLVVNPGEVCGYLTEKGTIAVLETGRLEAKILELSQDSFPPADTKGP